MIPVRTRSIFRSRWVALLWSAGIVWFAVDVANDQKPDAPANAAVNASNAADEAAEGAAALNETERLVRQLNGG
ncbi:hypothetical protein [Sphingomonas jatrophae]|uniref:Uncharacterized protein n=1 Tax=Sphingomonas jatrophae TaxID=1166337 RepID=A0A1I6JDN5_9SPHN|nr:hypothetical protein [Sphingomonas jatrophae]SFR77135.1 hypothetical protein SAMN05192580_0152 [Sphingomonas jatrophae]